MKRFLVAILIVGVIAMVALAGCGGGGGSTAAGVGDPGDPEPPKGNVITGRVVAHDKKSGLAGVTVIFGSIIDETGADGTFNLNLGDQLASAVLLGSNTFRINTSSEPSGFYFKTDAVAYSKSPTPIFYSQDTIPVPELVKFNQSTDLGVITTQPNHDPDNPNPPGFPLFEGDPVPVGY